jgi:hypothetical protein
VSLLPPATEGINASKLRQHLDDASLFNSFTDLSNWYGNNAKEMAAASQLTTWQAADSSLSISKLSLKCLGEVASYTPCSPPMLNADEGAHNWGSEQYSIEQALSSALMAEGSVESLDPDYLALLPPPPHTAHSGNYVEAYGQMTPPDDFSPANDYCPPDVAKQEIDSPEQKSAKPRRSQKAGTKRRKSASKDNEDSAAAPPAKKQRKRRGASRVKSEPEVEDEAKREKYLEKNRIAASKCRQKRKTWESELDARVKELSARRACLGHCVTALREEVIALKNELLSHVDCGCTAIHDYLTQSATDILPLTSLGYVENGAGPDGRPSAVFNGGIIAASNTLDIG